MAIFSISKLRPVLSAQYSIGLTTLDLSEIIFKEPYTLRNIIYNKINITRISEYLDI